MQVAIPLLINNRLRYLKQTLESIKQCIDYVKSIDDSIKFVLHPSAEPCNNELRSFIEDIKFVESVPHFNETQRGMNVHSLEAMKRASSLGDVIVQAHEDGVFSTDVLWYAVSMLRKYEKDDNVMYITTHHNNNIDTRCDAVFRLFGIFTAGIIVWNDWRYKWFESNWMPPHLERIMAYDTYFNNIFPKDKAVIMPMVERTIHIGREGGTYMFGAMLDNTLGIYFAGDFEPVKEWHEIEPQPINMLK